MASCSRRSSRHKAAALQALESFVSMREAEGLRLADDLRGKLTDIAAEIGVTRDVYGF